MTEREMFEKSFQRPSCFFEMSPERQWEIDKELGILDWIGKGLSKEDKERFNKHYK
jgi:CMP-N-acetylneuraminic acid synthetase